jgi:hypothetical protein
MPFRTIHWRKFFFAAAAIALIAATLVPTEASAEVGDGAARRSGWVWGSDCQPPIRITGVRTTAMAMVRATANAGYGSYGAYGYGCWRRVLVDTPWGLQPRRMWVCG